MPCLRLKLIMEARGGTGSNPQVSSNRTSSVKDSSLLSGWAIFKVSIPDFPRGCSSFLALAQPEHSLQVPGAVRL